MRRHQLTINLESDERRVSYRWAKAKLQFQFQRHKQDSAAKSFQLFLFPNFIYRHFKPLRFWSFWSLDLHIYKRRNYRIQADTNRAPPVGGSDPLISVFERQKATQFKIPRSAHIYFTISKDMAYGIRCDVFYVWLELSHFVETYTEQII